MQADLKTPAGTEAVKELMKDVDIFFENFKVGRLAKYGLDFNSLHALNPRLIYCSVAGFGQTEPLEHHPGYDFLLQGISHSIAIASDKLSAVFCARPILISSNAVFAPFLMRKGAGRGRTNPRCPTCDNNNFFRNIKSQIQFDWV